MVPSWWRVVLGVVDEVGQSTRLHNEAQSTCLSSAQASGCATAPSISWRAVSERVLWVNWLCDKCCHRRAPSLDALDVCPICYSTTS